jgi:hypothetical protein
MDIITHHTTEILGAALAVSEVLALIPGLEANGVLHGIIVGLRRVLGR